MSDVDPDELLPSTLSRLSAAENTAIAEMLAQLEQGLPPEVYQRVKKVLLGGFDDRCKVHGYVMTDDQIAEFDTE